MIHALTPAGRAVLAAFLRRRPLLAFDIDGTLAPIVSQPADARIPAPLLIALRHLAGIAPVAIVTGRARDDALRLAPIDAAHVLGNHGVEGLPGWESRTAAFAATSAQWFAELAAADALRDAGVLLEDKRFSLSLHYRHAPAPGAAAQAIAAHVARLTPAPRVIHGKFVVNVLPPGMPTKGDALRTLLGATGAPGAVYAGDDDTDEHVFELPRELVLGVRVGPHESTGAQLQIDDPAEMLPLVRHLIDDWPA